MRKLANMQTWTTLSAVVLTVSGFGAISESSLWTFLHGYIKSHIEGYEFLTYGGNCWQ